MPSLNGGDPKEVSGDISLGDNFQEQTSFPIEQQLLTVADLDLPIAESEILESGSESEGLVVFIPQTHLNPGTAYSDPKNNSAEIAQKEIYEIIDTLVEDKDVKMIMIEGEQFGQVDSKKTEDVVKLLDIKGSLDDDIESLNNELNNSGMSKSEIDTSLNGINDTISEAYTR